MEITVKGETVSTRPKPQARGRAVVLAAMAAMLGMGRAATGAAKAVRGLGDALHPPPDTKVLHLPGEGMPYIPGSRGRIRPTRIRGKPHRNPTPHRGTSRRANRNAKRRRARARSR